MRKYLTDVDLFPCSIAIVLSGKLYIGSCIRSLYYGALLEVMVYTLPCGDPYFQILYGKMCEHSDKGVIY